MIVKLSFLNYELGLKITANAALDEVPKNLWVDENLFSDTGINFLDPNFVKRL